MGHFLSLEFGVRIAHCGFRRLMNILNKERNIRYKNSPMRAGPHV